MKFFVVLSLLAAIVVADVTEEERKSFKEWADKHNKEYENSADEEEAISKFLVNKAECDRHNKKYDKGEVSYFRKLHEYSDLSSEEIDQLLHGFDGSEDKFERIETAGFDAFPPGPASVNWTEEGLVGPVRNQRHCGSCWAFSAVEVVQTVMRRKGNTDLLSPQQLVDCVKKDMGCHGGKPTHGLEYVKEHGLASLKNYPYTQQDGTCKYHSKDKDGSVDRVFHIRTHGNETWMKDITAKVGPVSIALCTSRSFHHYGGGVFDDVECCKGRKHPNHAPYLTGYGTDPKHGDYWIVKNSWGPSWGENGYIRIARNKNNICWVAHSVTYAK